MAIDGSMPWIVDVVDDKIQTALGRSNLSSLYIDSLKCKSFVAEEFLYHLTVYELAEQGLSTL